MPLKLQLFRPKVFFPPQHSLFGGRFSPAQVLRDVVEAKPSAELRQGYHWHVGNVQRIDEGAVYFALGRTTPSVVELFDEATGDFLLQEFDASPYTHVILDLSWQVCAIAPKTRLAPSAPAIARQLQRLLSRADAEIRQGAEFELAPINDPDSFLAHLRRAYQVTRFALEFTRPNPWDVERDFTQPAQRVLEKVNGQHGRAVMMGDNLDPGALEELTRSAASAGNDAEATFRGGRGQPPVRKRLKGNPVVVEADDCSTEGERAAVVGAVRAEYARVRASGQDPMPE